jgi:hypothetical protein
VRQELIDLLLGELEPAEADALRARILAEPDLRRELTELESLFGLMRRSEELVPSPATRAAVVAAAARVRPTLVTRLRAVPGLFVYRFRSSARFRVATISLCAHLVLIAVLAQVLLTPAIPEREAEPIEVTWKDLPAETVVPEHDFRMRLAQRRLSQSNRLRQYGVAEQEEWIGTGLATLVARQRPDGSFGDGGETGYAALALLAQGEGSAAQPLAYGQALRNAMRRILAATGKGEAHGAMLAALVEDFGLSYDSLDEFERKDYLEAIRKLVLSVPDDDISREALFLADLAGFAVPPGRMGEAQLAASADRAMLLGLEPTRLRATIALARGRSNLDPDRVRDWALPLFERALADLKGGNVSGVVLVTLQSPYRL